MAIGTAEIGDATYDAKAFNDVEELQKILRKKGMTPGRLRVVIDEGVQHDISAWSRRLPDALLFLYGK